MAHKDILHHGKTRITRFMPFGVNAESGHRVLFSDGKIRACKLAPTADTFFSVPARTVIRYNSVSGYVTMEENREGARVWAFHHHTRHNDMLPVWPDKYTPEHETLLQKGLE